MCLTIHPQIQWHSIFPYQQPGVTIDSELCRTSHLNTVAIQMSDSMQISPLTPPKLLNLLQDKFWRVMTRSQLVSMNTDQRIQAAETKVSTGLPSLTSIPFISTLCSIYKLYCSYLTMYRKHTTSIFKTNKTSSSLSDI